MAIEVTKDDAAMLRKHQKNIKKREKKKRAKQNRVAQNPPKKTAPSKKPLQRQQNGKFFPAKDKNRLEESSSDDDDNEIQVDYVTQDPADIMSDPSYRQFRKIFERFRIEPKSDNAAAKAEYPFSAGISGQVSGGGGTKGLTAFEDIPIKARGALLAAADLEDEAEEEERRRGGGVAGKNLDGSEKLSKKKMKKLHRLSVAELKQCVSRPDLVEMHDPCSKDPKLLLWLKAYRNTVPVPRHWCAKRKYLQGKRGIEKPPFQLPEFILNTGIQEMREAIAEKESEKTMKSKMREKIRPKTGKIDIDYQRLHDAFFRFQTKPRISIHGDLYYEGKEYEVKLKEKKPGHLTDELRVALGMPVGPNSDRLPPPWLIAMQRYGPPPSYPNLKIPGLNAPIPTGCSFGYHAGGWGKPPVDQHGRPLYGDVFGVYVEQATPMVAAAGENEGKVENKVEHWGELESDEESEGESDGEEEGGSEESGDEGGMDKIGGLSGIGGLVTPSGMTSGFITPGLVTPLQGGGGSSVGGLASISSLGGFTTTGGLAGKEQHSEMEIRKRRHGAVSEDDTMSGGGGLQQLHSGIGSENPELYKVIQEMPASALGSFMGTTKKYDLLPGNMGTISGSGSGSVGDEKRRKMTDSEKPAGENVVTGGSKKDDKVTAKRYKEFKF